MSAVASLCVRLKVVVVQRKLVAEDSSAAQLRVEHLLNLALYCSSKDVAIMEPNSVILLGSNNEIVVAMVNSVLPPVESLLSCLVVDECERVFTWLEENVAEIMEVGANSGRCNTLCL